MCRQNSATLQLQTFQTINSSLPTIYTGYLQIFSLKGPSCEPNTYSPMKIIPLSSSMDYNLFNSYTVNNLNKFLYSAIDGFLIDNYVVTQPTLNVTYSPLSKDLPFPYISFTVFNPYQLDTRLIPTSTNSPIQASSFDLFLFVIFCGINMITLACLIGGRIQAKYSRQVRPLRESIGSVRASSNINQHEIQYEESVRQMVRRNNTGMTDRMDMTDRDRNRNRENMGRSPTGVSNQNKSRVS